ncbi:hypothetical protein DM48_7914 [Burkholderia gladioli]|uniref:Uncharacterized protein n=1 Tax=Burkholderia gladioli TaxID=28095 RepID=A0AAW3FCQ6_BURGA|nr:hypothetical protein DM48_7914 [Burkholderia gladioli]
MRRHIATCIGCGCDDDHACWDDAQDAPCSWVRVDYTAGLGVCSACPDLVSAGTPAIARSACRRSRGSLMPRQA